MAGLHYSEWDFSGSEVKCELKHEIPQFGVARFLRLAGQDLQFRIDSFQPIPSKVDGILREISPDWEHNSPDPLIQEIQLDAGMVPVKLDRKSAAWLLSSLARGQVGSFDYIDWDDSRKKVHVRLSPVNYQKSYQKFKQCLKSLSHKGFSDYRNSEVNFALDKAVLGMPGQALLRQLASFVLADEMIKQVQINGHADDQGSRRYNQKLSQRRAQYIFDYLLTAGIRAGRMQLAAYGESRPKIASRSDRARAANRRAEIKLVR